ncbi:MAG: alanine racemase [Syntrophomonadaceae bacterium]|nr:alanine racemase [Syntrophomonadaceae bacterium]
MDNRSTSWAEIDLGALKRNFTAIRNLLQPDTMLMAVVKANAYGHGMLQAAQTCLDNGADYLAVANLQEALQLRQANILAPILVLGIVPQEQAKLLINNDIETAVADLESARVYSQAANPHHPARLHIKIDTGMGRIGFPFDDQSAEEIEKIQQMSNVSVSGIFSHFAVADIEDKEFSHRQSKQFNDFIRRLEDMNIHIPIKHIANSAAVMDMPETQYNMVRCGIIMYGLYPSAQVKKENLPLEVVMRLKTRINFLKILPPGRSVSYCRSYITPRDTLVATVPIGYADGYSRLLSNRAWAAVRGQKVPLIGNVCMDQCMFDVTGVEGVKTGDEMVLFGRPEDGITADDLAEITGTINYEVVCTVGPRIPRIYIQE